MGPGICPLTCGDQERGGDKSSTGTRRFKCRESGVSGSFSGLSGYAPGDLKDPPHASGSEIWTARDL
jgi:hypothetical protein